MFFGMVFFGLVVTLVPEPELSEIALEESVEQLKGVDVSKLSISELKGVLEKRHIEFPIDTSRADLMKLVEGITKGTGE